MAPGHTQSVGKGEAPDTRQKEGSPSSGDVGRAVCPQTGKGRCAGAGWDCPGSGVLWVSRAEWDAHLCILMQSADGLMAVPRQFVCRALHVSVPLDCAR